MEGGAALFIVVLVITLLLGIGMFSARTAHLAINASGGARQAMQTHYVAEYGLLFAAAKLSNGGAQSYLKAMSNPVDVCFGQSANPVNTSGRACYKIQYADIQAELQMNGGWNVCDPATSSSVPGSLGPSDPTGVFYASCDFNVELTDKIAYSYLGDLPAYLGTISQSQFMDEVILSIGFTYDGTSSSPWHEPSQ